MGHVEITPQVDLDHREVGRGVSSMAHRGDLEDDISRRHMDDIDSNLKQIEEDGKLENKT